VSSDALSDRNAALATVIVTHNSAARISEVVAGLTGQMRDGDELIIVDNASGDRTSDVVRAAAPSARILAQDRNLGFAAGCNAGVAEASAPLLFFLNPDARPAPGCLDALRGVAIEQPTWGAWQPLITMTNGTEINSAGNVAHFLGLGWAGQCGELVAQAPKTATEVDFVSGAALVVRREAWRAVEGFDERYFMYGEDLDLSLRLWLRGWRVGMAPAARVAHDYEFAKGPQKWFLLERNRWWTVLSDYPSALLALVLPALLGYELVLLAVAAHGGWIREKLRAQAAVLRDLPRIRVRRREVQAFRSTRAKQFARHLSARLDSPYLGSVATSGPVAATQRVYWKTVLQLLG
jgi:N-acetylglucosaminyl-diphospho-decaprenol L-rhamnosyltransferase